MFGPSYEAGCPTCSSMADTVDSTIPHLHARDVTMTYVSQAPPEKLQAYKRRMGWNMPWVSAAGRDLDSSLALARRGADARGVRADARGGCAADRRAQRHFERHRRHRLPHLAMKLVVFILGGRHRVPDLCNWRPRRRVPDGVLRDPRPDGEGAGRRRRLSALDPTTRRVRPGLTALRGKRRLGARGSRRGVRIPLDRLPSPPTLLRLKLAAFVPRVRRTGVHIRTAGQGFRLGAHPGVDAAGGSLREATRANGVLVCAPALTSVSALVPKLLAVSCGVLRCHVMPPSRRGSSGR